jgi:hypothetical protein
MMSAAYGSGVGTLNYSGTAYLQFTTLAPEELYFSLLSSAYTGAGIGQLDFSILLFNLNRYYNYTFSSLADAEAFFNSNTLDLGVLPYDGGLEPNEIGVRFSLTLTQPGEGFGFTYNFDTPSLYRGIPEPSTWVTALLGFAGLGFAGYRQARASLGTFAA